MTREQAINYLISSGFTHEQVGEVVRALTYEPTTKNNSSELEKNSKKLEKGTTKNDLEITIDAMEYRTNALIESIKSEILHFANAHCSGDDINIYDVFKVIDDCCEDENSTTKNDCEHCSKTYGTLGCCDFVSNEPVYSCKEGHEEYARGISKLGATTQNDLGVDCISRADAIRVASGYCHPSNVAKELAKLPSVTPQEPRKGHWLGDSAGYKCDICGHDLLEIAHSIDYIDFTKPHYCPNCGADMREVKE